MIPLFEGETNDWLGYNVTFDYNYWNHCDCLDTK